MSYNKELQDIVNTTGKGEKLDYRTLLCIVKFVKYIDDHTCVYEPYGVMEVYDQLIKILRDRDLVRQITNKKNLSCNDATTPHWSTKEDIKRKYGEVLVRGRYFGDPTVKFRNGWYFFDSAWKNLCGPFGSKLVCDQAMQKWVRGPFDD